jgi:hypothetical protein
MLARPLPCCTVRLTGAVAPVDPPAMLARPGSCHRVRLQRVCKSGAPSALPMSPLRVGALGGGGSGRPRPGEVTLAHPSVA